MIELIILLSLATFLLAFLLGLTLLLYGSIFIIHSLIHTSK